jgi:hypothetical protein
MRNITNTLRAAINASATDQVILVLLTMAHPSLASTQRFVNNWTNVVSRGETFVAFPFDVTLPDDRDDEIVRIRLVIDNVDRAITAAIRSITSPPTFSLEVVRAAAPDTVEAGPFSCTLRNVQYDALTVSGDLTFEDILDEPYPQWAFTPAHFPGLFK